MKKPRLVDFNKIDMNMYDFGEQEDDQKDLEKVDESVGQQEIDQAHAYPVIWVQFIPNQGKLLSIDIQNVLKVWDLQEMCLIFED